MNDRATERSPLNGSMPVASTPVRSPTRYQSRLTKVGLAGALAVALVLALLLSSRTVRKTTKAPNVVTGGGAGTNEISSPLMNGSEPWSCGTTAYDAGYIKLANKKDDYYFYWLVESSSADPSKDPLVLWLTGGPGGSSMLALLTENGPCSINADLSTTANPYAWSQHANVLWLDQPTGVGFSYSNAPKDDADYDEQNVGENIYWFLQGFLETHPQFQGREFFITGESYGGHYVPAAAHYIWLENQKHESKYPINLQGIAVGNGLTDPVIQYQYFADMATPLGNRYNISLLTSEQTTQMREDSKQCITLTEQCQQAPRQSTACADAVVCWSTKLLGPYTAAHRNSYDLRKTCSQKTTLESIVVCGAEFPTVGEYLDQPAVRKALHVHDGVGNWSAFYTNVSVAFVASGDWSFSYSSYVADLLNAGLRVLIYAGDADLVCNWLGNQAWTQALEWQGKDSFNAAPERPFVTQDPLVEGDAASVNAGVVQSFANFAFVRVYDAGHMVPTDQPAVALAMLNRFLRNEPF
jgi:carboxypeptidase C (cathepsin A)